MRRLRRPFGKKVSFDNHLFDSKLEKEIYCRLKKTYSSNILVHEPMVLYQGNELTKRITWKVDFVLPDINNAIEVKGIWAEGDRFKIASSLGLINSGNLETLGGIAINRLTVYCIKYPPKTWFNQKSQDFEQTFKLC